jgi:hypothetical protein
MLVFPVLFTIAESWTVDIYFCKAPLRRLAIPPKKDETNLTGVLLSM